MPFDVISFACTKADLDNRGRVSSADASSIAVVTSMLGNPLTSLFIGRAMADRKAGEVPQQAAPLPPIDLTVPPRTDGGTVTVPGAGTPASALPQDWNHAVEQMSREAQAFIVEARTTLQDTKTAAHAARDAATDAKAAAEQAQVTAQSTLEAILKLKNGRASAS